MTTPLLDERTEADIAHAPSCDASQWPNDHRCPEPAVQIARIYVRAELTAVMLLCWAHAHRMKGHIDSCPECRVSLSVELEAIGRAT